MNDVQDAGLDTLVRYTTGDLDLRETNVLPSKVVGESGGGDSLSKVLIDEANSTSLYLYDQPHLVSKESEDLKVKMERAESKNMEGARGENRDTSFGLLESGNDKVVGVSDDQMLGGLLQRQSSALNTPTLQNFNPSTKMEFKVTQLLNDSDQIMNNSMDLKSSIANEVNLTGNEINITNGTSVSNTNPAEDPNEKPFYVNAKQYSRILKRRYARARLEEHLRISKQRKPYLHESRHKHAMRRPRGQGGRFLTAAEIAAMKEKEDGKASTTALHSKSAFSENKARESAKHEVKVKSEI